MNPSHTLNMPLQTLQYHVDLFDLAGHRMRVRLRISQPDPVAQKVFLPTWIPGSYLIRDFARHIETFTAIGQKGACQVTQPDTHSWVVHNSLGPIEIDIVVYAWDLSVRGAHIDPHHAFFNGTSIFLCVEGLADEPCEVSLTAPSEYALWRAYTSMPKNLVKGVKRKKFSRQTTQLGEYCAPNYDALIDHPFEVGAPQTIHFSACGAPHQLVFTGHAPNLDLVRISRDAQLICESQIKLFEPKTQQAPFLDCASVFSFLTLVTADGYGGLEHRASTALITTRDSLPTLGQTEAPSGYSNFLGLLSHEYFHTWHVKRIKPQAFIPYDLTQANYTSLLWVFEGFTSYYDDLMLVRSGVMSEEAYFKRLGETIAGVLRQPGRFKQSVAQSSFEAWTKYYKQDENAPNSISSYYAKGSLVALCIDLTIRESTHNKHSLDDVMHLMWNRYGRDFYLIKGADLPQQTGLTENGFADIVQQATGVNLTQQINAWSAGTLDLPLKKCLEYAGITLDWQTQNAIPSLDANVKPVGAHLTISHVFENGMAHQAGLSAHDTLVAIDDLKVSPTRDAFNALIARYRPKDVIRVTVFRGDILRTFKVTLAAPALNLCALKRDESA
jgi:predicted metalloprotease with PDZ domain